MNSPGPRREVANVPQEKFNGLAAIAAGAICAIVACVYRNSLNVPFLLDDLGAIRDNATLHGLWKSFSPPNDGTPVAGRPVANFSFALNYKFGGLNVTGFHVGNIIIHGFCALLVFGILRRTFAGILRPPKAKIGLLLGAAIALLWAVHPLLTSAVTYLSQRVEALMAFFYLGSLYCFIRFAEKNSPSYLSTPQSAFSYRMWAVLSVTGCFLGMATKEVMVTAPLIILLYDWVFFRFGKPPFARDRAVYYFALGSSWLLLACLVYKSGSRGGTAGLGSGVSVWAYAMTQVGVVAHYLRLTLWPDRLVADYGRVLGGNGFLLMADFVVLTTLFAASALLVWRRSPWGFLGAWFFLVLSPTSSVVPISTEIAAEHRMYLPSIAVLTVLVALAYGAEQKLEVRSPGLRRAGSAVGTLIFLAVVCSLAAATVERNKVYRSPLAYWTDVVKKVPDNAGAWVNVGNAQVEDKEPAAAERDFREALRLVPGYISAHVDLGNLLMQERRLDEAMQQYTEVLSKYPNNSEARKGLGIASYRAGNAQMEKNQLARAAALYKVAVTMVPDFSDAHVNYGSALAELGRGPEALHEYSEALKFDPTSADIHNNLGGLLAQAGRLTEAQAQFEAAVRLRPDYSAARINLQRVQRLLASQRP